MLKIDDLLDVPVARFSADRLEDEREQAQAKFDELAQEFDDLFTYTIAEAIETFGSIAEWMKAVLEVGESMNEVGESIEMCAVKIIGSMKEHDLIILDVKTCPTYQETMMTFSRLF